MINYSIVMRSVDLNIPETPDGGGDGDGTTGGNTGSEGGGDDNVSL